MARDGPSRAELDTDAQRHDVHDLAADAAANAQRDSLASSMGENADDEVDSGPAPPPLALAPIPQLVVVAVPFAVLTEPRVLVPMAEYQLLRQLAAESIHQDTTISQLQAQLAQAQLEAQLVQAQLVQAQAAQAQQAHVAQAPAPAPPVQAPAVNGLPVPSRQRLYMGR
ncbi:hypothetical protein CHLRE_14g630982v5 [Chlamydomonas reinhardtii]|uniref:Uncharacterized protein n=1 Tax=Chlamydomonas reinhardtii TaxID=3055 RepID=A0A2K3CYR2_CHLRE|nr:uncharacterized protein CHLRE_14g630982v5 [Chlamydomonas reinhardtii]PNW73411.1 hypothetical protein CHLRE_14g630982v5 [Chlamydomonas reinhardtii]